MVQHIRNTPAPKLLSGKNGADTDIPAQKVVKTK